MSIDIRFENVFFNYAQSSFGLKNISFSINKGQRVAICGVNGAGKTTLLKLLMGIEFPKRGKIYVQDLELKSNNLKEIRKKVGFVFQNPDSQVFSASVYEDVAFGPRNYGYKEEEVEERVKKALKAVQLEEQINDSPFRLSFGQRKRVAIAGVLAMNPDILVLDEPFANLDYPSKRHLLGILEKNFTVKGKTIIFTTHTRSVIKAWSDKVLLLKEGTIAYNGPTKKLDEVEGVIDILGP